MEVGVLGVVEVVAVVGGWMVVVAESRGGFYRQSRRWR